MRSRAERVSHRARTAGGTTADWRGRCPQHEDPGQQHEVALQGSSGAVVPRSEMSIRPAVVGKYAAASRMNWMGMEAMTEGRNVSGMLNASPAPTVPIPKPRTAIASSWRRAPAAGSGWPAGRA